MRAGGNSASGELSIARFITGRSAAYSLAGRNRAFDLAAKFGRLNTEGLLVVKPASMALGTCRINTCIVMHFKLVQTVKMVIKPV